MRKRKRTSESGDVNAIEGTRLKALRSDGPMLPNPEDADMEDLTVAGDLLQYLQELYGPQATWSDPGQQRGVQALMSLEKDVMIILRTGIGKSAIAILPSFVERGITVIVIPLVSLLEDWKSRLTDLNVPFEVFEPKDPRSVTGHARIVLVSVDKSTVPSFRATLLRLNIDIPIYRVIFEEAHMWFTDCDYRAEAFSSPAALRSFPFQTVLLSATIPPSATAFLKDKFLLQNPEEIRGLSHRRELYYHCETGFTDLKAMAQRFIEYRENLRREQAWTSRDRFIVFVNSTADGLILEQLLGCKLYHSGSNKNPIELTEKNKIYADFKSGVTNGIVATSALGAGTDYPSIRLTCHIGAPFDLISFVQQSARAGRDGKQAHCLVLAKSHAISSEKTAADRMKGVKAMQSMVFPRGGPPVCVRQTVGEFMDGRAFSCTDFGPSWEACYACIQSKFGPFRNQM
jgi:superfamily II DNA helicase RecQ